MIDSRDSEHLRVPWSARIPRCVLLVAGVLVAGGCASGSPIAGDGTPLPPAHATATPVAAWPADSNQPFRLVGDPSGHGVWWWSATREGSDLFHYTPDAGITSYPLDAVAGPLPLTIDYGLAVSSDQVVLGAQREVIALDRASGHLRHWTVPATTSDPVVSAAEDSDIPVQVLGAAVHGDVVAVSLRRATAIEILDETSGQFSALPLPAGTEARDLVFDGEGDLGASLETYSANTRLSTAGALLVSADLKTTTVVRTESQWVAATDRTLLAGGNTVTQVRPDASTATWGDRTTEVPSGVPAVYDATRSAVLAAGRNTIMAVTGGSNRSWILPDVPCPKGVPMPPPPPGSPAPTPPTGLCPVSVAALAVDGSGAIWAVTSGARGLLRVTVT